MKGITSGYLNSCPWEAFTPAMIIHTTFKIEMAMIRGIPITIKHSGIASIIYNNMDNWKFIAFLPFRLSQTDSSRFESQQIRGPITPPNGKKKPAKADK